MLTWTKERQERLVELAQAGQSASEIALELEVTRNAVIGRCSRTGVKLGPHLKLRADAASLVGHSAYAKGDAKAKGDKRPKTGGAGFNPSFGPDGKPGCKPPQHAKPAFTAPDDADLVSLLDLQDGQCKWAFDVEAPERFCGQRSVPGSPYCACHKALAHEKPRTRLRAPRAA